MVLYDRKIEITSEQTRNSDLLSIQVKKRNYNFHMLVTYMDVKDQDRNEQIRKETREIMGNHEEESILMLGDFNGHLGFIGEQNIDRNGRYVLEIMENFNMCLLNGDDRCEGVTTREENGIKSVIDFALANEKMYSNFIKMNIDENKEIFDLSDHCLIKLEFKTDKEKQKLNKIYDKIEFYSIKEERKEAYVQMVESEIRMLDAEINMEKLETILVKCADRMLKKIFKKKADVKGKSEPIWFTEEIRENIKKRKHFNRLNRNANTLCDRNRYYDLYKEQKRVVQDLVRDAITKHEQNLTRQIRNCGRNNLMWENIRKLKGNYCKKETNVYDEEGKEIEINCINKEIEIFWKSVYQKHGNNITEIWNHNSRLQYIDKLKAQNHIEINFEDLNANEDLYKNIQYKISSNGAIERQATPFLGEQQNLNIPWELLEHFDMAGRVVSDDGSSRYEGSVYYSR